MAHDHDWIDVTTVVDHCARFVCACCDATKEEPLPLVNPESREVERRFLEGRGKEREHG